MGLEREVCLRCGHQWYRRQESKPVQCPKCRNSYWDRVRGEPDRAVPRRVEAEPPSAFPEASLEELQEIAAGNLEERMCAYREFDVDTGEEVACTLPAHSAKVPHRKK